ncbi:hypothetical protein [Rhizorhabdus argentea]|uniref:hypothetical protein n=1 Tax=Rhizorhabdus argentea TaxID=1387174 RepID=UPI0030ECE1D8
MNLIAIIFESVGLVVGSLFVAALFGWLCWSGFKLVGHPELGIPVILLVLLPFAAAVLRVSEFCRMVMIFMVPAAVLAWFAGIEWRKSHRQGFTKADPVRSSCRTQASWSYPAIVTCVGEARAPDLAQLLRVAKRIRREAYPKERLDAAAHRHLPVGFTTRRGAVRRRARCGG